MENLQVVARVGCLVLNMEKCEVMLYCAQVVPCSNDLDIPWFAAPVYTEEEVEMYSLGGESKGEGEVARPQLPGDPRQWSRLEVCQWVSWMCSAHRLPNPDIDRSVEIRACNDPSRKFHNHIESASRHYANQPTRPLSSYQHFTSTYCV